MNASIRRGSRWPRYSLRFLCLWVHTILEFVEAKQGFLFKFTLLQGFFKPSTNQGLEKFTNLVIKYEE